MDNYGFLNNFLQSNQRCDPDDSLRASAGQISTLMATVPNVKYDNWSAKIVPQMNGNASSLTISATSPFQPSLPLQMPFATSNSQSQFLRQAKALSTGQASSTLMSPSSADSRLALTKPKMDFTITSLSLEDEQTKGTLRRRSFSTKGEQEGAGKRSRHFWQYNVQAKGPKRDLASRRCSNASVSGRRSSNASDISDGSRDRDPHILERPVDPVFNPEAASISNDFLSDWQNTAGVRLRHTGKARRGDGNDLTPNVRKLANIGRELEKISQAIEHLGGNGTGAPLKKSAKKEKNKLASRGCRLKKKAQHEANKIKLRGLETQHRELLEALKIIRTVMQNKVKNSDSNTASRPPPDTTDTNMLAFVRKVKATKLRTWVFGRTGEYVNEELGKVGLWSLEDKQAAIRNRA